MKSVLTQYEAYLLTQKRAAPNTCDAYKRDLEQAAYFLKEHEKDFENATHADLKLFLHQLVNLQLSARSRSRKLSSLKAFYAWAYEILGWENITTDLVFPKLEKRLPQYLTEQEIELLFETAQKDSSILGIRNHLMLCLLYVSGVRITEMIKLKIADIQFDSGFIKISGKGGRERLVPLPQGVFSLLRTYLDTTHKKLISLKNENIEYLFPIVYSGKVKPISRQSFWMILKQLCNQANIKRPVSPHTLRHSLATHLLKKGVNLRLLQMLLGHESIATVQIYTHIETDHLRKIYDEKHPRA
ncbi:MAG: tyrosine recombinase [Candidatus Babeliales bacterium]